MDPQFPIKDFIGEGRDNKTNFLVGPRVDPPVNELLKYIVDEITMEVNNSLIFPLTVESS